VDQLSSVLDSGWIQVVAGAVLLLFGRRLFFLLLGAAGFLLGFGLVSSGAPEALGLNLASEVRLVIAVVVGLVCLALAFMVQRLALTVAGALLGGVASWQAVQLAGLQWNGLELALVLVGAVVGAMLIHAVFAVVLVGVSAWVGTSLILPVTGLEGTGAVLAGLFLLLIGVAVQAGEGKGKRERAKTRIKRAQRRKRHA
jgi:hypothetical protein